MELSTTYLGLKLKNPIVASASPLSRSMDSMRRLEDAEWQGRFGYHSHRPDTRLHRS